jgi:hypothetical protein
MALITIPPVRIEIDIPDLVIGEVSLKRKATLFTLIYNQSVKTLTLSWIVSYPDIEEAKGISPYTRESIADNTTMVDVATGAILTPTVTVDEETGENITTYPGDYIGQYDWFNMIAETQQLQVHDMIRQYGVQVSSWD